MKRFAVLSLGLLFAVNSQAQIKTAYERVKQAVTGSAKISQPHYFTSQWEVLAHVGLAYTGRDYKLSSSNGFDTSTKDVAINTELTLGVLDNLSLGINWDYDISDKHSYDGNLADENYKGATDPVINVTGRVGDFENVKIDLKLAYQPKTADFKVADDTHDGNAVNGYRSTIFGAEFDFLITNASQVFLIGEYSHISEKTSVDQTTGDIAISKAANSTLLKIGTLTEIKNDSFFGVTFSMLNIDGGRKIQADGASTVESPEVSANALTAVIKHEFTPNSALEIQLESILSGSLKYQTTESKVEGSALSAAYLVRF